MAAVTSSHLHGGVGDDTAQRVSMANSDQWDFSVPDPLESPNSPQPPPRLPKQTSDSNSRPFSPSNRTMITNHSSHYSNSKPIDLDGVNGVNGTGSIGRSAKRKDNVDPAYLSPYKDHFGPGTGLNGSRSGSEPDSLLDLYKNQQNSAGRSVSEAPSDPKTIDHQPDNQDHMYPEEEETTADAESGWIHREKLLQIEKKEMQELGITPPPAPRTHSRSKSRRRRDESLDISNRDVEPEPEVPEIRPTKEGKKRRMHSPVRQDEEPEELPQTIDMDPRTTDERAIDSQLERTTSPINRQQHQLRSSSSRIPLPRSSPMPMPKDDGGTPRKRGASSGSNDVPFNSTRSRNNSLNSTNLLNDDLSHPNDLTKTPPSTSRPSSSSNSPRKPRTSSLPRNTSLHNRKLSSSTPQQQITPQSSQQKPRSTSSTTPRSPSTTTPPTIRPKSRQGLEPRPPTAINRPEGEPPWIKEMYKPDPRLPPDQQMLPTHAKRLQQEQWDQARKESEARQKELGKTEAREVRVGGEMRAASSASGRVVSPHGQRKGLQQQQQQQGEEEKTKREQHMQSQRAFTPLALHTDSGLVASRDGRPGSASRNQAGGTVQDSHGLFSKEGTGPGRSPTGNYSPLPPLPKSAAEDRKGSVGRGVGGDGGRMGGDGAGGAVTGRRIQGSEKKVPLDPFEKERVGRLQEEEEAQQMRKGSRGKKEKEGKEGKEGKEVGCTCCVVM